MSPSPGKRTNSSGPATSQVPDELADRLFRLDESELRDVISYAKSLLPPTPTVGEMLEARDGEEILEVEQRGGYTKVVKTQPCPDGCDECPHGPYLYHVLVEKHPEDGVGPSLQWQFIGPVQ